MNIILKILLLPLVWSIVGPVQAQVYRQDIHERLANVICTNLGSNLPSAKDLWFRGLYEAGAELQFLAAKSGNQDPGALHDYSQRLAASRYHLGYSFGRCSQREFWVMTTPSPAALVIERDGVLRLDMALMKRHCRIFRVDYAPADIQLPRRLFASFVEPQPQRAITINTNYLAAGTLAVTCKPKDKLWLGAVMWTLLPVKAGPAATVPGTIEGVGSDLRRALAYWVNSLRREIGFNPLSVSPVMKEAAKSLVVQNKTILHNRPHLKVADETITAAKGKFLGENRVVAQTPEDAAWLLWNSPQHRRLIMSRRATHFETYSYQNTDQSLAVMVFGRF